MEKETVSVSKFKAECLGLLRKVQETGKPLIVTKRGKPLAQIIPPESTEKIKLGFFRNRGKITGDIISPVSDPEDWEVLR